MKGAQLWRRVQNYLRWRHATIPTLLSERTAELRRWTTLADIPVGEWLLRRPLPTKGGRTRYITARVVSRPFQATLITLRPNVFLCFFKAIMARSSGLQDLNQYECARSGKGL
jgi:hypothetical protein